MSNQNVTLNFKQFQAKHAIKFRDDKVSVGEQRKRYDDYIANVKTHAKRGGARESKIPRAPALESETHRRRSLSQRVGASPLMKAMLDPFGTSEAPRIPDGEFTTTATYMSKFNVPVETNDQGGFCIIVRPTPWAAYAVSNRLSNCATTIGAGAGFVSQVEFDPFAVEAGRYGAGLGSTPRWADQAWCIPTPSVQTSTASGLNETLQDIPNAGGFYDVAAAWRPVCCGARMGYTGAPIEASGSVAVAQLPGSYMMPTASNFTLHMNDDSNTIGAAASGSTGLTYESLQELPRAEVYPAREGFTAVWTPNGTAAQKAWRKVKPTAIITNQGFGVAGIEQYSNTPLTGDYILPPPVCGDPVRADAMIDRMMQTNANSRSVAIGQIAAGTLTYFQGLEVTGPNQDITTSTVMQNLLRSMQLTDMMTGDNAIVIIGVGCQPSTTIGSVELVFGFEYIADTRSSVFGGGSAVSRHTLPASKQIDVHAATMAVAQKAPTSLAGVKGGNSFIDAALGVVDDVVGAVPKIMSAVDEMGPLLGALLAAF